MSYTLLTGEIEKYLRANGLPARYNALTSTKEEVARIQAQYEQAKEFVLAKWREEKKYRELVSVAHGGWFAGYTEPLAEFFIAGGELDWLRFLCERDIRFCIEDMLSLMKINDDVGDWNEVLGIKVQRHVEDDGLGGVVKYTMEPRPSCGAIMSTAQYRYKALTLLEQYIGYLERLCGSVDPGFLNAVRELYEKVKSLSVKKKDLAIIKFKMKG